jgi:hypothetical protein
MKIHRPEEPISLQREADASSESVADFCQWQGIARPAIFREWQHCDPQVGRTLHSRGWPAPTSGPFSLTSYASRPENRERP